MVEDSAPKTLRDLREDKGVGYNHPPPDMKAAKRFRGYLENSAGTRFIEIVFNGDKLLISDGVNAESLSPWPPRDAVMYFDQPEIWTFYFPEGKRFFLRHLSKVRIPALDTDLEVLAGWLVDRFNTQRVALVAEQGWLPEAEISQLWPALDSDKK